MDDPRIKTEVMVHALIRTCGTQLLTATVYARGDAERGGLMVRLIRNADDVEHFEQGRGHDGGRVWHRHGGGPLSERASAEKLTKRRTLDPDLWILDIEDPWGDFTWDAPVVEL